MLPGLRSEPLGSVAASAASVVLRAGQIDVTFDLAKQPGGKASIGIVMKRFGWMGAGEAYPDRHFPELSILVDGSPAQIDDKVSAYFGSTDITKDLKAAGLDPFTIVDTPPILDVPSAGSPSLDRLQKIGAVVRDPDVSDHPLTAAWDAQRRVMVALPGGASGTTLTLHYKARPSGGYVELDKPGSARGLTRYCLDATALSAPLGRGAAIVPIAEYDIAAGIDDKPPQALTVELGEPGTNQQPQALAAFCGADGKPVIVRGSDAAKASARSDAKGVVHILSVKAIA
jgi:hypothetical protein